MRNTIHIKPHTFPKSTSGDLSSGLHGSSPPDRWQTERVNQEVEQFLQLFVNQHQDNWYDWLAISKFAYNNRVHTSRHSSPMLDTGQNPWLGIKLLRESHLERLNDFQRPLRWKQQQRKQVQPFPKQLTTWLISMMPIREKPNCILSDKVWLNRQNITTCLMMKLDHTWLGPYAVDNVISWNTYRLKLPLSFGWTHPVFPVTLLWPYNMDAIKEYNITCHSPLSAMELRSMK